MNNNYGKIVIITGASSGIGKNTAETLRDFGFFVYGFSRRGGTDSNSPAGGKITMLRVDITDTESVSSAVSSIIAAEGRIDILINSAGVGICGSVEEVSLSDARFQFEGNYFGILNMLNAVLPHMRTARNGLVINIGSVGGIYPIPFQTHYSASKAAVSALTLGLSIELSPFNVKAVLVEPGDIKTGFTASRKTSVPYDNSFYGKEYQSSIRQMERDELSGGSPDAVTKVILSLIARKNQPVSKVVGVKYKFFVFLKRILPKRTVRFLLTAMYPKSKL
ncbi:MAG: SDR family NAD(P)-dependent oxidoreductase [Clostridia bacterium]